MNDTVQSVSYDSSTEKLIIEKNKKFDLSLKKTFGKIGILLFLVIIPPLLVEMLSGMHVPRLLLICLFSVVNFAYAFIMIYKDEPLPNVDIAAKSNIPKDAVDCATFFRYCLSQCVKQIIALIFLIAIALLTIWAYIYSGRIFSYFGGIMLFGAVVAIFVKQKPATKYVALNKLLKGKWQVKAIEFPNHSEKV